MNEETLIGIKAEIKFACHCEIDEQMLKQASSFIIKAINHRLNSIANRGELSVDLRGSALFEHYVNEDPNFLIEIIEGMKAEDDKNRNCQTKKAYRR
ncbi:hypothetical protein FDK11_08770 [Campylobacter upsaliensis]|nr:hypothetical protein [Campylobacter upsaliensis]